MRIMLDTNILISSSLFGKGTVSQVIDYISLYHKTVICSYTINEFWDVLNSRFPSRKSFADDFFSKLIFEMVYTPEIFDIKKYPYIRDQKDLPILVSAIHADVDILLTGDKDLLTVDIKHPEILSVKDFADKYI